jgi:nucleotide-binding universal stress UspA family protein
MTTVLIAVDDSETSVAAARTAHQLFGDTADYIVLNVADSGQMIWGDDALQYGMVYPVSMPGVGVMGGLPFAIKTPAGGSDPDAGYSPIDDAAQTAENVASDAGLSDAMPIGETGDAAHAIVTAAIDHNADVIVIGSHDRSWFKRLLTPSVSGAVLRESNVPVLVAR